MEGVGQGTPQLYPSIVKVSLGLGSGYVAWKVRTRRAIHAHLNSSKLLSKNLAPVSAVPLWPDLALLALPLSRYSSPQFVSHLSLSSCFSLPLSLSGPFKGPVMSISEEDEFLDPRDLEKYL